MIGTKLLLHFGALVDPILHGLWGHLTNALYAEEEERRKYSSYLILKPQIMTKPILVRGSVFTKIFLEKVNFWI